LYLLAFASIWGLGRVLNFSRADNIVAVFCGSKKSLVHGSVMASLLFPAGATGLILLPLMLYHALQIILASSMAQYLGRQTALAEGNAAQAIGKAA
jgi:sodium/bile acid cotransporter 7